LLAPAKRWRPASRNPDETQRVTQAQALRKARPSPQSQQQPHRNAGEQRRSWREPSAPSHETQRRRRGRRRDTTERRRAVREPQNPRHETQNPRRETQRSVGEPPTAAHERLTGAHSCPVGLKERLASVDETRKAAREPLVKREERLISASPPLAPRCLRPSSRSLWHVPGNLWLPNGPELLTPRIQCPPRAIDRLLRL